MSSTHNGQLPTSSNFSSRRSIASAGLFGQLHEHSAHKLTRVHVHTQIKINKSIFFLKKEETINKSIKIKPKYVTRLVESLPSLHEALGYIPALKKNQTWWLTCVIPALGRWQSEDQKIKVIFSCIESLKTSWASQDLSLKRWWHILFCFV